MKLNIKLTLAFLLVSLVAIGLAAAFIWGTNSFAFNSYIQDQRQRNFASVAGFYYQQNGSWQGVERALQQQGLLPPLAQPGGQKPPAPPFVLLDANRAVVIPSGPYLRGQSVPAGTRNLELPIEANGGVVGIVLNIGQPLIKNAVEQQYLSRINQSLLIAALGGMLVALFLGTWLARTLTRPVNELTAATRAMARGVLEQQVPVRSVDELGELAASFNQMSTDLARANQLRRQMTADIAHDLRNPLTVIAGYLESLREGVLKPTPERFETMSTEVQHLQRLVEDLRTLSLAEAGELALHCQPVAPQELLERLAIAYQHQADGQKISLEVQVPAGLPTIEVDPERMEQVLGNLVSNALRYTPEGGKISLSAQQASGDKVVLGVIDTGSGIPSETLPHIFERSYRGEAARSGSQSGLGLSIAKSIVELHGGRIAARSGGVGQGTQIWIELETK